MRPVLRRCCQMSIRTTMTSFSSACITSSFGAAAIRASSWGLISTVPPSTARPRRATAPRPPVEVRTAS